MSALNNEEFEVYIQYVLTNWNNLDNPIIKAARDRYERARKCWDIEHRETQRLIEKSSRITEKDLALIIS